MNELVSVILPTYNRVQFLYRSIDSVLNQTYTNLELIIVDDGSTDNTHSVIKNYQKCDYRVKYLKNSRTKGVSGARNCGILNSSGDYIAFIDSDDEWFLDHIYHKIRYFRSYTDSIDLISGFQIRTELYTNKQFEEKHDLDNLAVYSENNLYILRNGIFEESFYRRIITTCAIVAKKIIFESIMFDEELIMNEDSLFVKKVLYYKFNVAYINCPSYRYYIHNSNTVSTSDNKIKINTLLSKEKYYKKLLSDFTLSYKIRNLILSRLSILYFWQIGYNYYFLIRKDHVTSNTYMLKGMMLKPINVYYWKTYIAFKLRKYFISVSNLFNKLR